MPESIRKKPTKSDGEVETLITLLSEYTAKLNEFGDDTKNKKQPILSRIMPVARELARYASQQIEHGSLDPLIRLELRLRLAEFEGVLENARKNP